MKHFILMFLFATLRVGQAMAYGSTETESNNDRPPKSTISHNYYICMAEMQSRNLGDVSGICATLYSQNQTANPRDLSSRFSDCFQNQLNRGQSRSSSSKHCSHQVESFYNEDSNNQSVELRDVEDEATTAI